VLLLIAEWTDVANNLLIQCHIGRRLRRLADCDADVFIALYENILGEKVPVDYIAAPTCQEDDIHNVQSVIDSLSLDYLQISLSHITGENVIRGDKDSIKNLLEIFDGLLEYLKEEIIDGSNNEFLTTDYSAECWKEWWTGVFPNRFQCIPFQAAAPVAGLRSLCVSGPLRQPPAKLPLVVNNCCFEEAFDNIAAEAAEPRARSASAGNRTQPEQSSPSTGDAGSCSQWDCSSPPLRAATSCPSGPPDGAERPRPPLGHRPCSPPNRDRCSRQSGQLRVRETVQAGKYRELPTSSRKPAQRADSLPPTDASLMTVLYRTQEDERYLTSAGCREVAASHSPPDSRAGGGKPRLRRLRRKQVDLPGRETDRNLGRISHQLTELKNAQPEEGTASDIVSNSLTGWCSLQMRARVEGERLSSRVNEAPWDFPQMPSPPSVCVSVSPCSSRGLSSAAEPRGGQDQHQARRAHRKHQGERLCSPHTPSSSSLFNHFPTSRLSSSIGTVRRVKTKRQKDGGTKERQYREAILRDVPQARAPPRSSLEAPHPVEPPPSGRRRPEIARPPSMKVKENGLLPLLLEELPHLDVCSRAQGRMWRQQQQQVDGLRSAASPSSRRRGKLTGQLEEAQRKHDLLVEILHKDQEHKRRLRELKEHSQQQKSIQNRAKEQRQQAARARKYYNDYHVQHRARLTRTRTREEKMFRQLFEEGLELQKVRLREQRAHAREQRQEQQRRYQDQVTSLENYYKDQFSILAEKLAQERQEVQVQKKAQEKVLLKMKRELRSRMEHEIQELQKMICRNDEDDFIQGAEVQRLRQRMQMASFHFNTSYLHRSKTN
uniref:DUF5745 domain-containing protein n=1 Tax=Tetraodon nigroviridis TaxID=99883 RepID=H3D9D3_TETNG